jgi:hypothetical protein
MFGVEKAFTTTMLNRCFESVEANISFNFRYSCSRLACSCFDSGVAKRPGAAGKTIEFEHAPTHHAQDQPVSG